LLNCRLRLEATREGGGGGLFHFNVYGHAANVFIASDRQPSKAGGQFVVSEMGVRWTPQGVAAAPHRSRNHSSQPALRLTASNDFVSIHLNDSRSPDSPKNESVK